jgi:hypothetical protein
MLTLSLGFILTPFGADPSGRYFIPLAVPMALFAAELIQHLHKKIGRWAWGLVVLVLLYNLCGTLQSAKRYPPGLTTQFNPVTQVDMDPIHALMDFLRQQGESRGYTNYWVAYPLAFLSGEELIFVPRLPYHRDFRYTSRDDRYPLYDEIVTQAGRTAFITTHHPELNERLRQAFTRGGISWQETKIGDFHVFYHLSGKFSPENLDFIADNH